MKNIQILHEDDLSIIINKPAGLSVQGGKGVKTSLDVILAQIRSPQPLLVHRLDKDTSGVLLAAKGRENAALFSRLLGGGKIAEKHYLAVCAGCPKKDTGIIKDELMIKGCLKKSETRYSLIKRYDNLDPDNDEFIYSVLKLELGTGRMHQIRRHLAMNGNPILGDDKYGDFQLNKKLRKTTGLKHLLLHASRLIIKNVRHIDKDIDYDLNIGYDISAPLPAYFLRFYQGEENGKLQHSV